MKKIIRTGIVFMALTVFISSCTTINKTVNGARGNFNGTWKINTIGYESLIANAVNKVFDQAPASAFIGSTWILTNSGNGVYTLADGTSQSIYWSYYEPGNGLAPMFQFKKVYQGDKPKNVDDAYRLMIGNIDAGTMTLKTPVDLGNGKTGYVVYNFVKIK